MPNGTQTQQTRTLNYHQAVQAALYDEMRHDPKVIILGINSRTANRAIVQELGEGRVFNMPISEQGFTCAGLGAALLGYRPVVGIGNGDFLYCAMDSIATEAAKYRYMCGGGEFRVPMVITAGTGMGAGAGTQHASSVEATFMHIPGLKVVVPASPLDAFGLFRAALRDDNPVIFLEHREARRRPDTEEVPADLDFVVPIGKASVRRAGKDVTVATYGNMVHKSLDAAEDLAEEGIDVEVIDLRSLLPWDKETVLSSVAKTGRLVTVSEDCKTEGTGAEIAATVAEEGFSSLKAPVRRVAYPDMPVPGGLYGESLFLLHKEDVVAAVKSVV